MIDPVLEEQQTNLSFQQITLPVNKKNNISSLYVFIEDYVETLVVSGILILDSIHKISRSDREAYVIELAKPKVLLYEDFCLISSHLSIDKYYDLSGKRSIKGFSFAHYTEIYKNEATQEEIVTHVYFDSMTKICSTNQRINGAIQEIDVECRAKIIENSELSSKKLKQLIQQKNERYAEAHKKSKELELELEKAFRYKLSFIEYNKIAKKFLEQINIINKYADFEIDARGIRINDILKQYQDIMNSGIMGTNELKKIIAIEDEQQKISTKPNTQSKLSKQQIKEQQIGQIVQALFIQKEQLKKLNHIIVSNPCKKVANAINQYKCVNSLKNLMLNFFFLQKDCSQINFKIKKLLDQINESINDVKPLEVLFKEKCISGEITSEEMKGLFNEIKDKMNVNYYFELLNEMISNSTNENHIMVVSNFLLERSHLYRYFIMSKNISIFAVINSNFSVSLAVLACIHNKYQLFYELTNYKDDPGNEVAVIMENKNMNLLKTIIYYYGNNLIDIEQIATTFYKIINQSKNLDNINSYNSLLFTPTVIKSGAFGKLKIKSASAPSELSSICSYMLDSKFNSYLEIFCNQINIENLNIAIEFITFLLKKSNFESMIRAFGLLIDKNIVITGYRKAIDWSINIAVQFEDLNNFLDTRFDDFSDKDFDEIPKNPEQSLKALAMIIYIDKPQDATEKAKKSRESLQLLLSTFVEAIQFKLEQEPFLIENILEPNNLYKKLLKLIITPNLDPDCELGKHNKNITSSLIKSCNFLWFQFMIKKNKSLSYNELETMYIEFMRIRYLHADLYLKKEHYVSVYTEFVRLINLSKFFNVQEHYLFKKIVEKKQEIEQKLKQQNNPSSSINKNISSQSFHNTLKLN